MCVAFDSVQPRVAIEVLLLRNAVASTAIEKKDKIEWQRGKMWRARDLLFIGHKD